MRLKRITRLGGVWVIFTVLFLFFPVENVGAQCTPTGNPLQINYTSLQMSCGASQNLSASSGCPPYNWNLSGGGTLTPSGGDNASATYVAPASNPNCANTPMITLADCCRNIVDIKLAVNCYTQNYAAYRIWDRLVSGFCTIGYCRVIVCYQDFKCNGDPVDAGHCYFDATCSSPGPSMKIYVQVGCPDTIDCFGFFDPCEYQQRGLPS